MGDTGKVTVLADRRPFTYWSGERFCKILTTLSKKENH